jgi:hypothetical protein
MLNPKSDRLTLELIGISDNNYSGMTNTFACDNNFLSSIRSGRLICNNFTVTRALFIRP